MVLIGSSRQTAQQSTFHSRSSKRSSVGWQEERRKSKHDPLAVDSALLPFIDDEAIGKRRRLHSGSGSGSCIDIGTEIGKELLEPDADPGTDSEYPTEDDSVLTTDPVACESDDPDELDVSFIEISWTLLESIVSWTIRTMIVCNEREKIK